MNPTVPRPGGGEVAGQESGIGTMVPSDPGLDELAGQESETKGNVVTGTKRKKREGGKARDAETERRDFRCGPYVRLDIAFMNKTNWIRRLREQHGSDVIPATPPDGTFPAEDVDKADRYRDFDSKPGPKANRGGEQLVQVEPQPGSVEPGVVKHRLRCKRSGPF